MNLRPMTMEDADKMLEWKNYPETRQFAIVSHAEIKKEDHYNWLEDHIHQFQIIEDSFNTYGAIRVEGGEVSIWLDRLHRGKGIAQWAIKAVSREGFKAKIVEGNIASMKAFIKAGYVPVEYVKSKVRYYIFKCV